MRQIKFRGKSKDANEWVFGDFFDTRHSTFCNYMPTIIENGGITPSDFYLVLPETVGQFTGLTDKNGKEIYEGDIIEDKNGIGVIMWFQTAWGVASYAHGYNGLKSYTAVDSFYSKETKKWAVIGSIHDNPDLLTK